MDSIDVLIEKLIKTYGTNNPRKLADALGITIIFEDLGNVWGYFHFYKRVPIVHVNSNLDDYQNIHTIAHEIGHYLLHPRVNTPFLKACTLFSVDKIEREANYFALRLIIGDRKPECDETKEYFLLRCGIPLKFHTFY